jgi:hypothetical protein
MQLAGEHWHMDVMAYRSTHMIFRQSPFTNGLAMRA